MIEINLKVNDEKKDNEKIKLSFNKEIKVVDATLWDPSGFLSRITSI